MMEHLSEVWISLKSKYPNSQALLSMKKGNNF